MSKKFLSFLYRCVKKQIESSTVFKEVDKIPTDFDIDDPTLSNDIYYVFSNKELPLETKDKIYKYLYAYDFEIHKKNFLNECATYLLSTSIFNILVILSTAYFVYHCGFEVVWILVFGTLLAVGNYYFLQKTLSKLKAPKITETNFEIYFRNKRVLYGAYQPVITEYSTLMTAYLFLIITFSFYVASLLKGCTE